jgi:hypothetical protein
MADSTPDRGRRARKRTESRPRKRAAGRASREAARPAPDAAGQFVEDELLADLRAAVDLVERSAAGTAGRSGRTGAGERGSDRSLLDHACQKLIDVVRRCCPGLLPSEPLEAGAAAPPILVQPKEAAALVAIAARQAVLTGIGARSPNDPDRLPESVLWQDGPDALLVDVGRIDVQVAAGLISVVVPVRCDQLPRGRDVIVVDLVLGTPDRPTGLLAAATEPRGPRVVVHRWGEALTALAWQAVLDTAGGVAGAAGVDRDGSVLVPTGLTASRRGIAVLAQARHEIDRVRPGQVVLPPRTAAAPRP